MEGETGGPKGVLEGLEGETGGPSGSCRSQRVRLGVLGGPIGAGEGDWGS